MYTDEELVITLFLCVIGALLGCFLGRSGT